MIAITDFPDKCVDKYKLADFLCVSVRTIEEHSRKIPGRTKIGKSIRYYLPAIQKSIVLGHNIFGTPK